MLSSPTALEKQRAWVRENVVEKWRLRIPLDFVGYAPVYEPGSGVGGDYHYQLPVEYPNGQTERFCELLGIPNLFSFSGKEGEEGDSWVEFGED